MDNGTVGCMVAHQRHRKKYFRMVKIFKVSIFFQNIICYFEFFYEKIYKIKNTEELVVTCDNLK